MVGKGKKKRSIGWRGEELNWKTAEGISIGVEWSNQVWQCDHTKVDVLVVGVEGDGVVSAEVDNNLIAQKTSLPEWGS